MEELIIRSKNGDNEAFTKLVLSIKNDLYRIARTRLKDDYDINDAIQETMISSYNHLKKLKDNTKFKSWIIKILINECNKIYKRKSHKEKLTDKIAFEDNIYKLDNLIQEVNSKLDFELLIQSLSYEEKIITTLFYNNGYSCSEIADILNMNVNTIKSKITRAKEKIRKYHEGGVLYE